MLLCDTKRPHHQAAHIRACRAELRAHADKSAVVMLIGNKADLADGGRHAFAEQQGLFFSEASALSGENVEPAFLRLLEEVHGIVPRRSLEMDGDGADGPMLKGTKLSLSDEMSVHDGNECHEESKQVFMLVVRWSSADRQELKGFFFDLTGSI